MLILLILAALSLPLEAKAYIDPGAGSVLLQGLLGVIAASFAVGAAYWRKVRAYFGNDRHSDSQRDG